MHTIVTLLVDHHPIAIERILQVTRYRGFTVTGLKLSREDTFQQSVTLEIASDRNIELLINQLAKIYHVMELKVGASLDLNQAEPAMQQAIAH